MRKGGKINYFLWIFIIVLILTTTIFIFNRFSVTGNVIASTIDCSTLSIQTLWDSIFQESAGGIWTDSKLTNGRCEYARAMKIKAGEVFILDYSYVSIANMNSTSIDAYHANFTQSYIDNIRAISSDNFTVFSKMEDSFHNSTIIHSNMSSRALSSSAQANQTWSLYFKQNFSSFSSSITNGDNSYISEGSSNSTENYSQIYSAYALINYTLENFNHVTSIPNVSCTPNWARQDTGCLSNETRVIFYNDSNNCNTTTGKTTDSIIFCDYDSNGVIGNASSLGTGYNFSIYISGSLLNNSLIYSANNTQQLVEIKNNGATIISFNHDFSLYPINLKNITIILNGDNSALGYIIINGINDSKTVYVDRKNSSNNGICVKDGTISSISDMSAYCIGNNEYIVNCSSGAYAYNCTINNNIISVSGLAHSAVREMFIVPASCSPNWTCANWSSCTNLIHTRTCSDVNSCNTTSGSPALSESCIPSEVLPATCAPNWNCTEWTPLSCSSGENQTRACTDTKACGTESGMPEETQECANPKNNSLILIILGVAILVIVIVAVILFTMTKKPSHPSQSPFPSQYPQPPRPIGPPVAFQPTIQERQFPPQPQQIGQYQMPRPMQQVPPQNINLQNINPRP